MSDLPSEHVPSSLKVQPEATVGRSTTAYVAAYEWASHTGKPSFGVFGGPYNAISEALEAVPPRDSLENIAKEPRAVIVRYNIDGMDDILYRWVVGANRQKWVKVKGAE